MRIARAARRCLQAGLALGAAGLLATSFAAGPSGTGQTGDYAPAPASTLVSRQDVPIALGRVQGKGIRKVVLAYQPAGQQPSPLAEISTTDSGDHALVSVHLLPQSSVPDDLPMRVVTLEHLYFQAMRLDPEAAFCFSDGERPCDAAASGSSHAALLRDLAMARQRALQRDGVAGVPWEMVALRPPAQRTSGLDEVGARIAGSRGPMQGVTLFFNRAPHSSCVATTGADGAAHCHLVDQHGDGDEHSDQDQARVLVTYPGDVRAERVLLPTTLLLDPS